MARKTVLVCDSCGTEVGEGKGAVLRVTFNDARTRRKAGGSLRLVRRWNARRGGRAARSQAEVARLGAITDRRRTRVGFPLGAGFPSGP